MNRKLLTIIVFALLVLSGCYKVEEKDPVLRTLSEPIGKVQHIEKCVPSYQRNELPSCEIVLDTGVINTSMSYFPNGTVREGAELLVEYNVRVEYCDIWLCVAPRCRLIYQSSNISKCEIRFFNITKNKKL